MQPHEWILVLCTFTGVSAIEHPLAYKVTAESVPDDLKDVTGVYCKTSSDLKAVPIYTQLEGSWGLSARSEDTWLIYGDVFLVWKSEFKNPQTPGMSTWEKIELVTVKADGLVSLKVSSEVSQAEEIKCKNRFEKKEVDNVKTDAIGESCNTLPFVLTISGLALLNIVFIVIMIRCMRKKKATGVEMTEANVPGVKRKEDCMYETDNDYYSKM
eukprot:GFUD01028341.1.p1 GENE.GFUD01028341.1~~GFUD01028341.1.p1  ORF type:complete len:213 (+),score=32.80 GFUD01028341.1:140-778(+)